MALQLNWRRSRLLFSSFVLLLSCINFTFKARRRNLLMNPMRRRLSESPYKPLATTTREVPLKVLYTMTSLNEFDNGRRNTKKGQDRFHETLLPVALEGIQSMVDAGYQVDFYLIAHFRLSHDRRNQLRATLPAGVGIQIWDDATPIGYAVEKDMLHILNVTRALARQHRYVIKDKFLDYDVFVNFEDDMLVKADHVQHFVGVTDDLYRLRQAAAQSPDHALRPRTKHQMAQSFHGNMTVQQLQRMIPGFIRVEATLPGFEPKGKDLYEQIPKDFYWDGTDWSTTSVDAAPCCHVSNATANDHIPAAPNVETLYFWETSIDVLGVRQMPEHSSLGWVLLQAGNVEDLYSDPKYVIGDYWSGRDGYFGEQERPERSKGRYMNNQGGWMGTRRQIFEWHTGRCPEGFLPPFDRKGRRKVADGLGVESVEYWSGGIQIAGRGGCNLQRLLTLQPDGFSRQLLYHTSNNKQRQSNVKHRFSSRSINQLWGQLNTIRKNAESRMQKDLVAKQGTTPRS